jgi:hypothetical protein
MMPPVPHGNVLPEQRVREKQQERNGTGNYRLKRPVFDLFHAIHFSGKPFRKTTEYANLTKNPGKGSNNKTIKKTTIPLFKLFVAKGLSVTPDRHFSIKAFIWGFFIILQFPAWSRFVIFSGMHFKPEKDHPWRKNPLR